MKTVTIDVASLADVKKRAQGAFGGTRHGARLSFASPELLWSVLTAKRWALLRAMAGGGAMSLREAARRAERDVKAVHGDAQALLKAGILRKTEDGKVEFPYDRIHVDFMLQAA